MTTSIRSEDGSLVIELVLFIPAIGLLIWLVLWAGVAGQTPGELTLAASDAARAAAATRDPTARPGKADQLVRDRLQHLCDTLEASTTQDGQLIRVTVDCQLQTDAMRGLGVGPRIFQAAGVATVDRYIVEGE